MILINKSLPTNKLIFTLGEANPFVSGSTLELFDTFTNKTYQFSFPADSSAYPNRYNQFIYPTETFSALTDSVYTYYIRDIDNRITETGLIKVLGNVLGVQEEVDTDYEYINPEAYVYGYNIITEHSGEDASNDFISITENDRDTENDFIVYQA